MAKTSVPIYYFFVHLMNWEKRNDKKSLLYLPALIYIFLQKFRNISAHKRAASSICSAAPVFPSSNIIFNNNYYSFTYQPFVFMGKYNTSQTKQFSYCYGRNKIHVGIKKPSGFFKRFSSNWCFYLFNYYIITQVQWKDHTRVLSFSILGVEQQKKKKSPKITIDN